MASLNKYILILVFAPLFSSILVGLTCRIINNKIAHSITTGSVFISLIFSIKILYIFLNSNNLIFEKTLYIWGYVTNIKFEIGFLIDRLTSIMLFIVSFISFLVHLYTIGYMKGDGGYNRFFSYISFFTFAMFMLVVANNFVQLFFGWEGVGLASYLLIGFWFKKESAIFANLKAFIVNRIGDLGFLLGIAAILCCFGTLNYKEVFSLIENFVTNQENLLLTYKPFDQISAITFISICLFIGAMGKSAQIPLHVWLPYSMEGPTPISALIHAATMVTAGIFMVARMSPIFEYSENALTLILIIGTSTCFLMGILGIIQTDIKRIIAYSTLSQLGLMVAALGVSAYSAAIFHLFTHAFFKALLFLGAGAIITALHHEQDIRNMGNLRKHMPITFYTMLIASLALCGIPGFSGFFSKDLILDSINLSTSFYAKISSFLLTFGIFFTAFYSFRMLFLVFYTNQRTDEHIDEIKDCSWVITFPLIILAIFSLFSGWVFDIVINDFFSDSIFVKNTHHEHNKITSFHLFLHGFFSKTFIMSISGIVIAWYLYCKNNKLLEKIKKKLNIFYFILHHKYGFDVLSKFISESIKKIGEILWILGDKIIIDKFFVHFFPFVFTTISKNIKNIQTGRLYNYVYIMITGFIILLISLAIIVN